MIDDNEQVIEDVYSVTITVDDIPEEGLYAAVYGESLWPSVIDQD